MEFDEKKLEEFFLEEEKKRNINDLLEMINELYVESLNESKTGKTTTISLDPKNLVKDRQPRTISHLAEQCKKSVDEYAKNKSISEQVRRNVYNIIDTILTNKQGGRIVLEDINMRAGLVNYTSKLGEILSPMALINAWNIDGPLQKMTEDLLSSKKLTPQSDVISFDNPFELPSEGAPSQTMPLIDSFIKTKDGKFIAISSKDSYDPSNSSIYGLLYVYKKHPINIQRETLEILELCDKNRDKKIVSDEVPVMLAVSYKLISEKEALVLYSSMRKDDLKEKTCIHTNQTTTILENNLEDIPEPAETIDDPNVTKKKIYTNPPEIMPPVDDSLDDTTVPEEEKFPCQRILEQMKDSATKKMAEDRINKIPSEERTNKLYAYSIRSALAKRLCDIINDKGIFNKDAKEILTRCSVVQMFCVGNYLGNKQGSIENFKLVYPPVFEGKLYLTCERYNSLKMAEGKFTFSFTKPKDAVD